MVNNLLKKHIIQIKKTTKIEFLQINIYVFCFMIYIIYLNKYLFIMNIYFIIKKNSFKKYYLIL